MDRGGNLYGTGQSGGIGNNGTVFKMTHHMSGWTFSPIYQFKGGNDGSSPAAGVVFGPQGLLYGTTFFGGGASSPGTAYVLQPPATACKTTLCFWSETVIHTFGSGNDGGNPGYGSLTSDGAGNLYGTAQGGPVVPGSSMS
jgi:uncharacterized repeat protein (TIGR03803 family)